jgi:hypothetical protein
MLELLKDLKVSLNLTLELETKLQSGQLSLLLLMAKEESLETRAKIQFLEKKSSITNNDICHLIGVVLKSKSWAHFMGYFKEANTKCHDALMARESSAAKTLIAIASNQFDIFGEIVKLKK